MPTLRGRDQFYDVVRSEGVKYLFANPGTTELPIFDELAGETGIDLVLGLHEATAVAAADGYAQTTRQPALVNLHIAPGVANGMANLFNAFWARSPLVITAGTQHTGQVFQEPILEADLARMVEPFTKWSYAVKRPADIGGALRRAFKIAMTPPTGPVFVSIPWDFLDAEADVIIPEPSVLSVASIADRDGIARAARALAGAKNPAIIAGDEVARRGAVPSIVAAAEALGARVYGEPLHGRLVFPMDHPLWVGAMPPVNAVIRTMLEQHDVVLVVGAKVFAPFFPTPVGAVPPSTRLVQIDTDPYEIAKTYAVEVGLVGDLAPTLAACTAAWTGDPELVGRAAERARTIGEARAQAVGALLSAIDAQQQVSPLPPIAAAGAIVQAFGSMPITVVDESVSATTAVRAVLTQRDPDSYLFFRGGALGWAAPASIGAALGQPERRVVAISGDGALCYVPHALWTLAHRKLPVTLVVVNNTGYNILKMQLAGLAGLSAKEERYPGCDITEPAVDFAALAKAFGVGYAFAEKAGEVTDAVRAGIAGDGPVLVEVPIDPTVHALAF